MIRISTESFSREKPLMNRSTPPEEDEDESKDIIFFFLVLWMLCVI
jgi:hypothetical protein